MINLVRVLVGKLRREEVAISLLHIIYNIIIIYWRAHWYYSVLFLQICFIKMSAIIYYLCEIVAYQIRDLCVKYHSAAL